MVKLWVLFMSTWRKSLLTFMGKKKTMYFYLQVIYRFLIFTEKTTSFLYNLILQMLENIYNIITAVYSVVPYFYKSDMNCIAYIM